MKESEKESITPWHQGVLPEHLGGWHCLQLGGDKLRASLGEKVWFGQVEFETPSRYPKRNVIWNSDENCILCHNTGYHQRSECWQRIEKGQGLSTGSHQHPTPWRKEEGSTKRTSGLTSEVGRNLKEYEVLETKWRKCLQEEGMIN